VREGARRGGQRDRRGRGRVGTRVGGVAAPTGRAPSPPARRRDGAVEGPALQKPLKGLEPGADVGCESRATDAAATHTVLMEETPQ